ncbi:30S ribosomal protein S16 [Patescibacteria group bacterium]|nr:30S ribosomal protein S16 [Patescibacteria group bacterium]
MLKIRLSRFGKKKKPTYRLIVSEHTKDTQGKALEYLGHYDPHTKVIEVKKDRILDWISKGAQPSPTVHNLLVDQNVIEAEKVVASKSKKKNKGEEDKPVEPVAKLDAEKLEAPKDEPKKKEVKEETKKEEKVDRVNTVDIGQKEKKEKPSIDSGQEKKETKE